MITIIRCILNFKFQRSFIIKKMSDEIVNDK